MRSSPVLIALLVGLAVLLTGPVAATTAVADGQPERLATQPEPPEQPSNASIDSFTLKNVSGEFTIEELTVEQIQTKQGTVENATLEDATVTVDNATVMVGEVSSENRTKPNATASIVHGEVTIENASVTANGHEFQVQDRSMTIENGSITSDAVDERDREDLPDAPSVEVTADELERMIEGSTMENVSITASSEGMHIDEVTLHGAQVDERTGGGILGNVAVDSLENATITAEEARIEDGMLILEEATVSVDEAQVSVTTGIVEVDETVKAFNNEVFRIEDSFTVDRLTIQLPRSS